MTDHIPNDLSHLNEAEFNALCPQGEHAPGSCASFYAAAEWGYYQALREQRAIADELEVQ
jgi:hypothetical protein